MSRLRGEKRIQVFEILRLEAELEEKFDRRAEQELYPKLGIKTSDGKHHATGWDADYWRTEKAMDRLIHLALNPPVEVDEDSVKERVRVMEEEVRAAVMRDRPPYELRKLGPVGYGPDNSWAVVDQDETQVFVSDKRWEAHRKLAELLTEWKFQKLLPKER